MNHDDEMLRTVASQAMTQAAQRGTLLGRLAGDGWFSRRGEVTATTALAILLEDEPLRVALLSHLMTRTKIDVTGVTQFEPELWQEDDRGRPDLEGQDDFGLPLVKIEAKFAAEMSHRQLLSFVEDQLRRLGNSRRSGAFVVLVPAHRKAEAEDLVRALPSTSNDSASVVASTVITWDELLEVLDGAALDAGTMSAAITADLVQFRDLCKTLEGLDIEPLGEAASGRGWQQRARHLERIVERVTEKLSQNRRLLPTGKDALYTFRRYVNSGPDSYMAVGIVAQFAEHGTPLWLRYHRLTPAFAEIASRLQSSSLEDQARHDEGHIWLPLKVPADVSGARVVETLVEEVRRINSELTLDTYLRTGSAH